MYLCITYKSPIVACHKPNIILLKSKTKNDAFASSDHPPTIIERIEAFVPSRRIDEYPHCTCKTKNYFHYSLVSLPIHVNYYHRMTFQEMGSWLESKGISYTFKNK